MTPILRILVPLSLAGPLLLAACGSEPVRPDPIASVRVTPDTAFVRLHATQQLHAAAVTASGSVRPGVEFSWSSSDTSVAIVSAAGIVAAKAYGNATIRAEVDGVSGSVLVRVTGEPGLRVIGGAGVTDTITGIPPGALVVELRDSRGLPMAGQRVVFTGVYAPGTLEASVEVQAPSSFEYGRFAFTTTDAAGRASARVRMGRIAGPGSVDVRSTEHADTAHYTIRAGAPARVRIEPRDTAVFAGRAVQLRHAVADRGGNPLPQGISFSVAEGPATVDPEKGVVATSEHGEARVVGRIGTAADTVRVAAVPEGAIVVSMGFGDLVVMNLDGTGRRTLEAQGYRPSWSPDGARLVYQSDRLSGVLMTVGLAGEAARLIENPAAGAHHWPQYARDGAWIYFFTAESGQPQVIWRVRPDGTGMERVGTGGSYLQGRPSPSPDGTRIAFFVGGGTETYIRVRDLATGAETANLARGHMPAWSPAEDLIAFNELRDNGLPAGVLVMRADGSGLRRVSPPGVMYNWAPTWSPDGRWILATGYTGVHLIEVETGLVISLSIGDFVASSAWKPGPLLP